MLSAPNCSANRMFFISVALSTSLRTCVRAVSTLAAIQGTLREAARFAAFLITPADVGLGPMQTSSRSPSCSMASKCTPRSAAPRRIHGCGRYLCNFYMPWSALSTPLLHDGWHPSLVNTNLSRALSAV
jgi:hypothetical protein